MPKEIHLWRVVEGKLEPLPDARLDLESRLEDWLVLDPALLGRPLLVLSRQVATDFGGYIDLLCIDSDGELVVVELKRDKTPRDVTAQLLDYASWVTDLSAERVTDIAERHLKESLDSAFRRTFGSDLPEVINSGQKLLVVGSSIDAATERIIHYLSQRYGVNINAVTFQYFRLPAGEEVVGAVHLIEPEMAEQASADRGGRRRGGITLSGLEAKADERGVGALYRQAFDVFQPTFNYTQTSSSSLRFAARFEDRTGAVLNLLPASSDGRSLPFQLYTYRLAHLLRCAPEEITSVLPPGTQSWEYQPGDDSWWQGHAGVFRSIDDCQKLRKFIDAKRAGAA